MVNTIIGEEFVTPRVQVVGFTILYFQVYDQLLLLLLWPNLYRKSDQNSMIMARIEQNYIADLGKCIKDWCEIDAGKYDGWIRKTDIWGVAPDEIR